MGLYTLKVTKKQVYALIEHADSPYIRGVGFMYLRYTLPPQLMWDWFEPYLDDEEEIDIKAGGGKPMTIGEMCRLMLTRLEWFDTRFPRIAVNYEKQIRDNLEARQREQQEWENEQGFADSAAWLPRWTVYPCGLLVELQETETRRLERGTVIPEPGTESPSQETRGQDHVIEGRGQNIESRAHGIGGQGPEIGGQGQETGSRGLRTVDPGQRTGNPDTGLGQGTNLGIEETDQGPERRRRRRKGTDRDQETGIIKNTRRTGASQNRGLDQGKVNTKAKMTTTARS